MTTLLDAAVAIALASHGEERERVDVQPVVDVVEAMRSELTPHFQKAWDDPSKRQAHRTGKRMGKSEYIGRRLFRGAYLNPRSVNPYITPTAKSARLRMWPIIKRIATQHFPDAKINESTMTVTLPKGGVVVVGGCENRNDIGNWFGIPFAEAGVDECGTFPPYLGDLIEEGLKPSMMDFGGSLVLAGNPGVAPIGYWYEITGPKRLATIPLYVGDARDNPHVKAAPFFAEVLEENGWTEDHPTFQRMYLGNWAWDPSALCFPYSHERNAIDALPEVSLNGGPLDKSKWRWVIAADVGGVGITAIVIMAAHPGDPRSFVWSSESHPAWLPEQLVERVRAIKADRSHGYDMSRAAFVVDTGGLGSVHAVHLTRKAGDLNFEAAEKADKKSSIRDNHDEILSGRQQFVWHQCQGLIDQMAVAEWDEKHEQWVDGPPDHELDSMLYGKRRQLHFTRNAITPPPTEAERLAAMEQSWIDKRLAASSRNINRSTTLRTAAMRR